MELIEVSDQNFLSAVSTASFGGGGGGQNYILQGFNPATHYINGGGGRAIEVIDELSPSGTSFVQVMEPSPTVLVNYVIGPNGSLIPVYDNCLSLDNTLTFVTGAPEPYSEPSIPPHILDHMYAKKPKEPGTETAPKPRKRVKKKEPSPPPLPPPPVVKEYVLPDILTPNTTKVNIIRKGGPQQTFRSVVSSSRPKILQTTKTSVQLPQRVVSGGFTTNDLSSSSSTSSLRPFKISSSPASSSTAITSSSSSSPRFLTHTKRIVLNNKSQIQSADSIPSSSTIPTQQQQSPSIYFLPPKVSSTNIAGSSVLGNSKSTPSYLVTTTTESGDGEGENTDQKMCFVLPSNSSSLLTPDLNTHPPRHQQSTPGHVTTYQLNSDGTISPLSTQSNTRADDTVMGGDHKQEAHSSGAEEMYTEYSICTMADDLGGGGASGGGIVSSTTGGTFQLGDKQVYFSYE